MTVTLEEIEAKYTEIGDMIAAIKRQKENTEYPIQGGTITLTSGERYAGVVLGDDGRISHHLLLLADETDDVTFDEACSWADALGVDLPTRKEQALLYANLKGEFESQWYWSAERHADNAGWAWYQHFSYGHQSYHGTLSRLRARAVRRLIPSVL